MSHGFKKLFHPSWSEPDTDLNKKKLKPSSTHQKMGLGRIGIKEGLDFFNVSGLAG